MSHYVKSVRIRSYSGLYSTQMRGNADQNNSEYEHFLRSVNRKDFFYILENIIISNFKHQCPLFLLPMALF